MSFLLARNIEGGYRFIQAECELTIVFIAIAAKYPSM